MNQILYYVPGQSTRERLLELLPGRFDGSIEQRQVMHGPLDQPAGVIAATPGGRLELAPDQQDWHLSGCGQFCFGWWRDKRPTPQDLLRAEPIEGSHNRAGWLVPRIRRHHLEDQRIVYSVDLPRQAKWNGQAFESGPIIQQYRPIAELAESVHNAIDSMYRESWGESGRLTLPDNATRWVAEILQINHRVGPDELAVLEAFRMEFASIREVLEIFVSRDHLHQLAAELSANDPEKKRLSASS